MITHGGNNTTTEAFHFGKPMIVLPLFWDQYDNAQRVDETGFGVRLPTYAFEDADLRRGDRPAARRRALPTRMAEIGAEIRAKDGVARAAEAIEAVGAGRGRRGEALTAEAVAPRLRSVRATRYVTAFREGGSLPGLVEADDDGLYVVKFRGAGQGPRALVAEWLVGEIGRAIGLLVPDIVAVDLGQGDRRRRGRTRRSTTCSSRASAGTSGSTSCRARSRSIRRSTRGRPGLGGGGRLARRVRDEPGPDARRTRTCSSGTAGRG